MSPIFAGVRTKIMARTSIATGIEKRSVPSKHFVNVISSVSFQTIKSATNIVSPETTSFPNFENVVRTYFDFTYWLLASPFRIGVDEKGKYKAKTWWFQRMCCGAMQLLCLVRLVTEVRIAIQTESACNTKANTNPVHYFKIVLELASLTYKAVTIKRVWRNQEDYIKVLNLIRNMPPPYRSFSKDSRFVQLVCNPIFLRAFFTICTAEVVAGLLLGKNFVGEGLSKSFSLWSGQLLKLAQFTFFSGERNFNKSSPFLLKEFNFRNVVGIIGMALCMLQRFIHGLFCDLFILSFAVTLWLSANSFAKAISTQVTPNFTIVEHPTESNENRWSSVYAHFVWVQKLSIAINTALGGQVTWYLVEAVMFYSVNMNIVLTSHDAYYRIDKAVFYIFTFAILFVSADICSMMESVKVWILQGHNRKLVPNHEMNLVLHEMVAKDIGIRGSSIFTITYSLLAVFFSTIVTYFIICVQHENDSSNGGPGNFTNCS